MQVVRAFKLINSINISLKNLDYVNVFNNLDNLKAFSSKSKFLSNNTKWFALLKFVSMPIKITVLNIDPVY